MHVLFLHQSFPGQFGRLALSLKRRHGWRCSFLVEGAGSCPSPSAEELAELPLYGVRRMERRITPWNETYAKSLEQGVAYYEALKALPDLHPDLIVSHQTLAPTLFLRDLMSCPMIQYCEYYYAKSGSDISYRIDLPPAPPAPFYPRCVNAPILVELTVADGGYAPTRWQRQCFPERYRPRIEVHFDGVDTDLYRPAPVGPDEARALLGGRSVPDGTRVVTFVARGLESMRGFDLFLRVAGELCRRRSDVLFVVAGGEMSFYGWDRLRIGRDSFKEWALSQGDYDLSRFVFLGQVEPSRLARLLCLSDLHIYLTVPFVPSWSLFDALSCACVVLASDVPPVREVIEPGVNGLVENLFDGEALTATALRILADPAEFRPLGQAGRQLIESRYSEEVCHPELKEYFERMASMQGRSCENPSSLGTLKGVPSSSPGGRNTP
jgi:glycosyltransferase involved in cell wall biosynthesis